MKLSIIIPCYNERNTIQELINAVKACPVKSIEIIIVDDCSTDGTRELLVNELESLVDKVIYHQHNRGKGAAIRSGLKSFTGEVVVIQDADLEYDPQEYPLLMDPIIAGKADVVFGSRFKGSHAQRVVYFWHFVGNKFLTLLSNMLTNINLTDMETCYKMLKKDIVSNINLKENRFGIEPELTAKVARSGARIYEVGISYYGRTYAEGKKIGWKDGFRAIYAILKYNIWEK